MRVKLILPDGKPIQVSSGDRTDLLRKVIAGFCPRYAPGAEIVFVGDAETKYAYANEQALAEFGVSFDQGIKMPDMIALMRDKNWLILIQAATNRDPIDDRRHCALKRLFARSSAGLVFVSAFLDQRSLAACVGDISWESEVWVAEAPSHLIHFDGTRFLGPYDA